MDLLVIRFIKVWKFSFVSVMRKECALSYPRFPFLVLVFKFSHLSCSHSFIRDQRMCIEHLGHMFPFCKLGEDSSLEIVTLISLGLFQ